MGRTTPGFEEEVLARVEKKTDEPPLYRVLLHNDDYTTREFVVQVLVAVFNKPLAEAARLMWHVHRNGIGTCGLYPLEVAETKITQATAAAREHGFPLKLTLEAE
jgi:ATP-dependent Clp protease adaptor protein ClpS